MRLKRSAGLALALGLLLSPLVISGCLAKSAGWETLFNGKDLQGWTLVGRSGQGYTVEDGLLVCPSDGGGNLFTDKEYSDFVFHFDFRLSKGANNGIGIRAPLEGDAAYQGMEIQVLDDPNWSGLQPWQFHGSIYGVFPAKQGALKPTGQWNTEEILAQGRHVKVTLNGKVIVDANLDTVSDPQVLIQHPGLQRTKGHIGFLGHTTRSEFRNIRVKDLSGSTKPAKDNTPPPGFTALFNGKDLKGWKGLVDDPPTRAKMSPEALKAAEQKATEEALKHWRVQDGAITYDGKNNSLCTVKDYRNFDMFVDWKIEPGGDSGIYLRGSPQVQIWDNPLGSGGLYNNQKGPSNPLVVADNPPGQWNRFRILMLGDKVTVWLNGQRVVDNVVMENYWERDKPIYPTGQIELQHHGSNLWFKNIYVRELP